MIPDTHLPSLETRMDDVRAVMDAVGSERAVVFGVSEGGPMAMLFAATYPERTIALVLFGTESDWSHASDERLVAWLASYLRRAASPGAAIALGRMNGEIDVTPALRTIHVPVLVLARSGDLDFPLDKVRQVAEAIPGARYVEFPGDDHFDGFLATFDGPARAIRCATAIEESVRDLGIEVRAGLHTGECELIGEELGGIAVHIGARVAAHAGPSEVWVSQTVKDLVAGSGLAFEDRGEHELKGVPDRWRLYRVVG